jgi:HAD superfamily phosphoserine phosphatase-like hydrolase
MIPDPSIPCVAADLEGTLTTGQTWRGIRAYLEQNGRGREYSLFFAVRLPSAVLARVGVLDKREFENRYTADTMRFFRGLTPDEFRKVAEFIVEHELWPKRRESVLHELEALRLEGRRLILASGTYQPVLEAFAWRLEAEAIGTRLEIVGGKLTGRLSTPVNVGQHKVQTLRAHLAGATLERAYGDTMPDAPMLSAAQVAVVVNPDAKLGQLAQTNNWRVLNV